jgi:NAD(P)H-hydrate epimerase
MCIPMHDRKAPGGEQGWLADPAAARHALLTTSEMYGADAAAIAAGVSGRELMERAGAAVAKEILLRWKRRPVAVLCGPGNNGGDGFVAARHLALAGWDVRLFLLGSPDRLKGEAATAARAWSGAIGSLSAQAAAGAGLIVDALFGAGLDRPLEGIARAVVETAARSGLPIVAVDVPSGVSGDTGEVLGAAAAAQVTVTFFRKKPAHLLLPAKELCGDIKLSDIGIPDQVLAGIQPSAAENHPSLWSRHRRSAAAEDHKFTRGHVVVIGGEMSGAARLAGLAAARAGAGMVSLCVPSQRRQDYVSLPASLIIVPFDDPEDLPAFFERRKVAAILIGPGLGRSAQARQLVETCLATGVPAVLDADALTVFAGERQALAARRKGPLIVTPHAGEFARVWGEGSAGRLARAREAAADLNGTVVLKGSDTIIAAPDGRAIVNGNAPPWLATAGAGDVLAGMILALVGQRMPVFEAAAAGVWLHGAAAAALGPGLIADDLPGALPAAEQQAGFLHL